MSTLPTTFDHCLSQPESTDLFQLLCERRGWSNEYLTAIESEEHDELKDVQTMIAVLEDSRVRGAKITIAPDFDMDGISSGVLGYAGLSELGFDVELHLPDYRRGHDLSPADIDEIHARWPSTEVLLTCDGGVNSHAGLAAARGRGWITLVTDHHQELKPGCTADVTVNPCRMDETYALRGICGAHVLHQVLMAYARRYRPDKRWSIHLLRLFAGLGTVSDVMPILFENRQMVRDSLSIARLLSVAAPRPNGPHAPAEPDLIDVERSTMMMLLRADEHHPVFTAAFQGFAILLKAFAQTGKLRDVDDINEGFYGFYVAPAMNAPRRTGDPMRHCFTVFCAFDPDEKLEAAHQVIAGNERRKEMTAVHLEDILAGDQPLAPWVFFSAAPAGMYGLLANQLMRTFGHPVVVVNVPDGPSERISGSGRAPGWFDIITALEPHEGMSAIGHQQACGVRVENVRYLGELLAVLEEATRVAMLDVDTEEPVGDLMLGPSQDCDAGLENLEPLVELVRRIDLLRPFGHGFPEPVFQVVLEPLGLRIDRIGSGSQHLRLVTRSGLACLWWNAAQEHCDDLRRLTMQAATRAVEPLHFTAKLQLNTFRGDTRLQVVIADQL